MLIKAVIQVIPTYAMGCFKLPVGLCDEIKGLNRRFWWGNGGDKRKVNWLNWKKAKTKRERWYKIQRTMIF